ncbi:tetratricopeptide repeat protein [Jiangella ureilytica]|uniref:Tetratricopeptide repeat protein n=1 Tax=Jiangella ureilytica TaxID=2530374 RepID=A0A4R4RKL6_9ACTN|nr:AAA family ATPase [Jiangella ureilytica]TDC50117.1 tetratricopeptide repeat protein [Jiangella ureilytica]
MDAADGAELQVRLAGGLTVVRAGRALPAGEVGDRKGRTLLALLAVAGGRLVTVDHIVEALWPGQGPRRPAASVATLVSRLRAALGPDVVAGGRSGYRLGDDAQVDLHRAAELACEAEIRLANAEPAIALAAAQAALELVGAAPLLAEEADAPWAGEGRRHQADVIARARAVAAEAGLRTGDVAAALAAAEAAAEAEPLDERPARALMRAYDAAGEPARALAVFERLRAGLAAELGIDPAPSTRELHVAILRQQVAPASAASAAASVPAASVPAAGRLAGRESELTRLTRRWERTVAGDGALVLLAGEAGIGKTALADEAARIALRTGGRTLEARCYDVERSLFLQPVAEALGRLVTRLPVPALRQAAADRAGALAALVPEVAALLGEPPPERRSAAAERARIYDAVVVFLRRLAARQPLVFIIDDLHNAGAATVELLHYLGRRTAGDRLLVVGTVRADEGERVLATLAGVAERLDVGPLDEAAIARLAAEAGQEAHGAEIARRTRGHTLFVVETLRALAAGDDGIPDSLRASVMARVRRAGPQAEELLHAAAVLGTSFTPMTLAGVLDLSAQEAARRCHRILPTRLLVVAGRSYEFENDLVQETLYSATPEPTRVAYHLRAADVQAGNPEAVGWHAGAAGDWARAGPGWLAAGEQALRRYAVGDAEALLSQALDAAGRSGDVGLDGRAHLARGRAREAMYRYDDAVADHAQALRAARAAGDRPLEMRALRQLGGPAWAGGGRPVAEGTVHLEESLRLAQLLGDRPAESELLAWLSVLSSNRLRFDDALAYGRRALALARDIGDDDALALALDGVKTAHAYLGEVRELGGVLAELEPLCRRSGDLWLLQWCVFESAFPAIARGDWDTATARVEEALAVNRRSGYSGYESWYVSNLGWIARLGGRYDDAVRHGRRSLTLQAHAWFSASSLATYATTLLDLDQSTEAVALLERGLAVAGRHSTEAYRLPCLAALAAATDSPELLDEAGAMVRAITAPPGSAWLYGADTHVALARARLRHGDPAGAAELLAPLEAAAERTGWTAPLAAAREVAAACREALRAR